MGGKRRAAPRIAPGDELRPISVPAVRVRALNRAPIEPSRELVLYWMIAARRTRYNFALQHAAEWAALLDRPLLVLEPLRAGYRWASERFHRFVLDGMADNQAALARGPVGYYPYLEPVAGAGHGLLAALAVRAAVVVTDDYPGFFLPRMVASAAAIPARLEAVDGNGLYPLRATDRVFTTAASFRRHLQATLPDQLADAPRPGPLVGRGLPRLDRLPAAIITRWPPVELARRAALAAAVGGPPAVTARGGSRAAGRRLTEFLDRRLDGYAERRNHPAADAQSHLAPYLHFGHISAHQLFAELMAREGWGPHRLAERPTGSRTGWWGASADAEAFLDQLITWRELGFNAAAHLPGYDRFDTLPAWARATLEAHRRDPRPVRYSREQLERAETGDPLWNAAQTQLLRDGTIHNYLRMLWGKKVLEWSPSPRRALALLLDLNNRYAVDGRDPNSVNGVFWIAGRYDRAWGPARPIFGTVRYLSSAAAARKLDLGDYLERYRPG